MAETCPDTPFKDPRSSWVSVPATDIFSLGSIFYTIMIGYWPFKDGPPDRKPEEHWRVYEERAESSMRQGIFPPVSHLDGGDVIKGCWDARYKNAEEVLQALRMARAEAGA